MSNKKERSKVFKAILMSGATISLILFIFRFLGYIYMDSYLSYFNVNISFYSYNFFADFGAMILIFLIFLLPIIEALASAFLINHFIKIPDKNSWFKSLSIKRKSFLILFCIFIIVFPLVNKKIFDMYNITQSVNWIFYYIILIAGLFFKWLFNKIELEYDFLDFAMIIIILLPFYHYSIDLATNTANNLAIQKEQFAIIEGKSIALYNTKDYAIVSEFKYNEENNTICILNNRIKKINLDNQTFSYKTFDKVQLESKGECNLE